MGLGRIANGIAGNPESDCGSFIFCLRTCASAERSRDDPLAGAWSVLEAPGMSDDPLGDPSAS